MNDEVKAMLQSMFAALESIRDSIVASKGVSQTNPILRESIKTNSYLSDISDTLREQLEFFRDAKREAEFDADKAKAAPVQKAPTDESSGGMSKKAGGKIGGFLEGIGIGIGAIAQGLLLFSNPKILLGILNFSIFVAAMGAILGLLIKFFGEDIANFIRDILFAIGAAIVDVGIYIGENKDALMDANEVVADFVGKMLKEFSVFLKDIAPILMDILEVFLDFIRDFVKDVLEALLPYFERLLDSFDNLIEKLPPIIDSLTRYISRVLDSFDNLVDGIVEIVNTLSPHISELIGLFNNIVDTIGGMVEDITGVMNNVIAEIRPILEEIKDIISTVGEEIRGIIREFGAAVEGVFNSVFGEDENSGLQGVINKLGLAMQGVIDSALGGLKDLVEQIGDTINSVITNMVDNIIRLSEMDDGKLLEVAAGIVAIAGAMALFAGAGFGTAIAGIATGAVNALGDLFGLGGNDPFEKIKTLAELGPEIDVTTNSIRDLMEVLGEFAAMQFSTGANFSEFASNLKGSADDINDALNTILTGRGNKEQRMELLQTLSSLATAGVQPSPSRTTVPDRSSEAAAAAAAGAAAAGVNPTNNVLSSVSSASNNTNSFNTNQLFITSPGGAESTIQKLIEAEIL